ncbi:recombinase family protein [Naumannella halotolerans]|uniref:DNA invertase Pin-like site-specific DNA recombinase n=1 Tax=Naumannella halotolerans TaxID=993414 RepID=A0A4R7J2D3_9ACTN|nr:recombinase family protein [Naumannella halotolerans]TDT31352.1 DNA invertase Pin-like site-specific DNA recombinase [Naumannella halotolerans]
MPEHIEGKGQRVAYVRVSSADQNPARQVEAIGESADRIFTDHVSGSTTDRPALEELLAYVRDGDQVIVSSMDRLARSTADLHSLVDGLTDRGVGVQFLKEGLAFHPGQSDPTARLLLGVMGSIAEFERAIIRERQREGIALAKERGVYRGRRSIDDTKLEAAQALVGDGLTVTKACRQVGVSRSTYYARIAG